MYTEDYIRVKVSDIGNLFWMNFLRWVAAILKGRWNFQIKHSKPLYIYFRLLRKKTQTENQQLFDGVEGLDYGSKPKLT